MPPWNDVREALLLTILLPFNVAAALLYAASRVAPQRGVAIGGFAGIVLAFMAANDFKSDFAYRLDSEKRLTIHDLGVAGYDTAMGNANEGSSNPKPIYWLPWAALLAGGTGLMVRIPQVPKLAGFLTVVLVACIIARWLVPPAYRADHAWGWPALAATVILLWASLEAAAKSRPGGVVPAAIAFAFLAASVVMLHAHFAKFVDIAMIAAGTWFGLAAVAWQRNLDVSILVPFAAVLLPGLMFVGRDLSYSEVPLSSFLLVALSPLAFAPALILQILGKPSPRVVLAGAVVLLLACTTAVVLAARAVTLDFD